ncbi:MAG: beta-lactamase family protein [Candidatus Aminicenantes bacterium]|nr:beta-lactamase family protein [Candidatus Aminicenantes bacterium]
MKQLNQRSLFGNYLKNYFKNGAEALILGLTLISFLVLSHCFHPQASLIPSKSQDIYPGKTWERYASPEAAGFSSSGLQLALEYLKTLATTSLVVVHNGRILLDYGDTSELSYLASVRKSVLSMLFGIFIARGQIRLNKTLAELNLTDHGGLLPQELEATIEHLLSARSGVYHPASNSGDHLAYAPPRGSKKPGTYFLYSNWDFNALGTIFEQETGLNIYEALEQELAIPLEMEDFKRERQRKSGDLTKSIHPAYHMWISTRDMARLGYLMLKEGNWRGKQIIPRDWVKKSTSAITRVQEMNPEFLRQGPFGYGYLWWVFDGPAAKGPYQGAYMAIGALGQFITVIPKLNLVIAHKVNNQKTKETVSRDQYLKLVDLIVKAKK